MNLVVVESPTKARTISKFLGDQYLILATMGHIRDLPKKKLGVDVSAGFLPEYIDVPKRKDTIKELKAAVRKVQTVYLATDPDREGEAIAWHVVEMLKEKILRNKDIKILRISFHEITKSAIEKALSNPGTINIELVNAQQARRILDRLVGYKLSPLLWRKVRTGLSAGRVQSVAVRLIVEREREIEKFIPQEYWEIGCQLRKKIGQKRPDLPTFLARLVKKNGKAVKVSNRVEAEETVAELKKAAFEVEEVKRSEVKKSPSPPLITSTLQRTAFTKLGFSSKQTMRLAQSLYEQGLITYHRTDSVAFSSLALQKIRQYIAKFYPADFLPNQPRFYKTHSKLAQEAHEAIRPTEFNDQIQNSRFQNEAEFKLYQLIFKRTVASQMMAALYDQTRVFVRAEEGSNLYTLLAQGRIIKFLGWLAVYDQKTKPEEPVFTEASAPVEASQGKSADGEKGEVSETEKLPPLSRGDELTLIKVLSQQKFSLPPPRFDEASLIKALEERGIGRPSTYAPTISTIQDRQYIEKIEKKFKPTVLGVSVNDFLVEYFGNILDYDFTAKMEDDLDDIARAKKDWVKVVGDFYQPFNQKLEGVTQVAERVKIPVEVIGEKCPKCSEGELVIRVGRFGKFISCSRFPACDYKARYIEKLEGVKCPDCGGEIVIRKTKKGRQFYGCLNYPKCKWASWRKPK